MLTTDRSVVLAKYLGRGVMDLRNGHQETENKLSSSSVPHTGITAKKRVQ